MARSSHRRRNRNRAAHNDCPTGKVPFVSHRVARGALVRLNGHDDEGRVYHCPGCGWWHMTRQTRSERDAMMAERLRSA